MDTNEGPDALPAQEEFWSPPVRFGSVPVEKEPLGWDRRKGFRKLFPQVMLPTQVVERVSFGHPELEPNRLFWGDNLHVMRQLPSESIDLIYIDPPFFSGRQYNVIFGDQNELRSFSDIWEGGMPGYLIWLNARLYEMKRLLKKTGTLYVHCDWHASHYIKVEMDKLFGNERLVNEVVWCYKSGGASPSTRFSRKHDVLLMYARGDKYFFNPQKEKSYNRGFKPYGFQGVEEFQDEIGWYTLVGMKDYWEIDMVGRTSSERIGYPTQKPETLVERVITCSCPEGGVVADFFVGGGTTPVVAQRLGRRWIACDQSRVAVAITADRLAKGADQLKLTGIEAPIPDFTIEHWGVYEAKRLSEAPPDQFREFILRAFGATPTSRNPGVHGIKGTIETPIWVGEPRMKSQVTANEVEEFANAVRKTVRYQQDNLRDGIMLAWAFRPDAMEAAQRLREMEQTDLNFIRLDMVRIDSPRFREHVSVLTTDHADYASFLTFVQPPRVEVGYKRLKGLLYAFDVTESIVMNPRARIINVQWDFNHKGRFRTTQGYSFLRTARKEPALQAQYEFPAAGRHRVACRVQDDMGGEGFWVGDVEVE
jgi:DNA modification methylase